MRSFGVSFRDEKITADSIKRNYLVTRVVMAHVNKMLDVFQTMCERSNRASDKRRCCTTSIWRRSHPRRSRLPAGRR